MNKKTIALGQVWGGGWNLKLIYHKISAQIKIGGLKKKTNHLDDLSFFMGVMGWSIGIQPCLVLNNP